MLNQRQFEKQNAHIRELLARKYELEFPKGIELQYFIKEVKKATSGKDDPGIPIYLNPVGLSMEANVVVEPGETLANVLQRALKPLNLRYDVHDGFLEVDSRLGLVESRLTRVEEKLDRVLNALEKQPLPR